MDLHRMAWLFAILSFAHVCSMPTNCVLKKHLMKTSYTYLQTMGGLFPLQCLQVKDKVSISFPQSVFESNNTQQVTDVEKAIYQTLQNIDILFENDGAPNQWDEEKMDNFKNLIYRQVNDSKCIMNKSAGLTQDFLNREAALKVYFQTISTVLTDQDFDYCAWEILRGELLHTLDFILKQNADIMF